MKEELDRILSQVSGGGKADSVSRLLQDDGVERGTRPCLGDVERVFAQGWW